MSFRLLILPWIAFSLSAQTATLRGHITDDTGAVIPGAKVAVTAASGIMRSTTTQADGSYTLTGLATGHCEVRATAPDLALREPVKITLRPGGQTLDLQLKVVLASQHVNVQEAAGPGVATDPSANATAVVLRGQDLEALGDDPEDLQTDLQALAGPSAGPNGGAIYVDGFSGGQLPAKESIREIRVNANPFSPEYDKLGLGRIEIFTKPGTDKFRGTGFYNFGDSFWNSRDPFAQQKAPFLLKEYGGNLSGPINGRASFFLDIQRHAIDNGDIINGTVLDPQTLATIDPYTAVFRTPQRRIIISPRVDWQLTPNNTMTFRYGFTRADVRDAGIGGLNLVERGDHAHSLSHIAQISETAVLGASVINETRFQFFHAESSTLANNPGPAIQVLGSFNGGGSPLGRSFDAQNTYEFQNYTSVVHHAHAWRFGVRVRGETDDSTSYQNFGGTFVFAGGPGIQSIERYRRTLFYQHQGLTADEIRALGGGATQFSISAGQPSIAAGQADIGLFAGDDWRVRPNLTLSLGLRYETQTNIPDWRDFAPRAGFAWAPGTKAGKGPAKTVLRGGFGMFYDRFALADTIAAQRYNGVIQQQYIVTNPDFFPLVPPIDTVAASQSTSSVQKVSSTLRAPYIMQSAFAVERQLVSSTTVAVTFANSHGLHQLRSAAINAPLPGSGIFPFGTADPIFLRESSGLYNQNQLITNVTTKLNRGVSLFGYYVYNRALSNTDGLNTFPANPYSSAGEYGPASTDIRHRVSAGGSLTTKWDVRLNPLLVISSGPPFDITTGSDPFGDTLFNARPGIATDPMKHGVVHTAYGWLDPNPTPDETILPRNYGRGPGSVLFNVRVSRVFTFGPSREGGGGSGVPLPGGGDRRNTPGVFTPAGGPAASGPVNRRYALSVSMSIRNLLNHTNPGPINGNITSPLFGRANQTAGATSLGGTNFLENANNRRLELQLRFTF